MTKHREKRDQQGVALLLCTFLTALALVILATVSIRLTSQARQTDHLVDATRCFWGVETALSASRTAIETGETGSIGLQEWQHKDGTDVFVLPSFDEPGVAPFTLPSAPDVEYYALAMDWGADGRDNTGDGVVDGPEEAGLHSIHAFARVGQVVRGVEVILRENADDAAGRFRRTFTQVSWREIRRPAPRTI